MNRYRHHSHALLVLLVAMFIATGLPADEEVEKAVFLVVEDDKVIASNAMSGQFADLDFSAKEKLLEYFVANGAAVVITNQRYAGYGAFTGGWRSIRRIAGEKFISAEVQDYSAQVVTSERVLTFNGKGGAWSHTRRGTPFILSGADAWRIHYRVKCKWSIVLQQRIAYWSWAHVCLSKPARAVLVSRAGWMR